MISRYKSYNDFLKLKIRSCFLKYIHIKEKDDDEDYWLKLIDILFSNLYIIIYLIVLDKKFIVFIF
jgi:hypothetical protein